MRLGIVAFAILGLGLIAYLVLHVGVDVVLSAIAGVGIGGFLLLCGYGLFMFALLGAGWFVLDSAARLSEIGWFIWGRAVRDSAGEVLPFSQLGGFVIGARAVSLRGVPASVAFASTASSLRLPCCFIGCRQGLVARFLPAAAVHASGITHAMKSIHARPLRIVASFLLHVVGWLAAAGFGWLAVRLIGRRIDFASIIAIEGMLCAIRSAAIFVPSAYGVQEASYAMLMPLFGLGPDVGLAVSLLRRGRDIALGIPILLAWQAMEGRRALAHASPPAAPEGRA